MLSPLPSSNHDTRRERGESSSLGVGHEGWLPSICKPIVRNARAHRTDPFPVRWADDHSGINLSRGMDYRLSKGILLAHQSDSQVRGGGEVRPLREHPARSNTRSSTTARRNQQIRAPKGDNTHETDEQDRQDRQGRQACTQEQEFAWATSPNATGDIMQSSWSRLLFLLWVRASRGCGPPLQAIARPLSVAKRCGNPYVRPGMTPAAHSPAARGVGVVDVWWQLYLDSGSAQPCGFVFQGVTVP
ncbi:hypothetical protein CIB48_g1387 [Xylaria polymorpha]|nr:hypothetical protein CIB48_g1387 [Xylaria polymorpha]